MQPLPDGVDFLGRGFLLAENMVKPEDQQGVGVGEDPLVDGKAATGLINPLEDRHRVPRRLTGHDLERHGGAVKKFQRPGDALDEMGGAVVRFFIGGPGDDAHLGHGGKSVLDISRVAPGFPRIAPRPINTDPPLSRCLFARRMDLVVGDWWFSGTHDGCSLVGECGEVAQGVEAGHKEVGSAVVVVKAGSPLRTLRMGRSGIV